MDVYNKDFFTYYLKFDWILHYNCNYYCPYCSYFKQKNQPEISKSYIPADEWIILWNKINEQFQNNKIFIKCGEAFIYPGFVKILNSLLKHNKVYITTNLSCDISFFINQINSNQLKPFIDARFHPSYSTYDEFLKKLLLFKENNFPVYVSYTFYPAQFDLLDYYREKFESEGFNFILVPFKGVYKNKKYVKNYTEEEKEILIDTLSEKKGLINDNLDYVVNEYIPKDKLISVLQNYIFVKPDGSLFRNNNDVEKDIKNIKIGNIKYKESIEYISRLYFSCNNERKIPKSCTTFFNWDIHYKCNYRCTYCFCADVWDEISKGDIYPGVQRLVNIWSEIYKKYGECRIDISGGEPFIYPDFLELISEISKMHKLRINTNLAFNIQEFLDYTSSIIEKRGPDVLHINSSFHPDWANFEDFIKKIKYLKDNDYIFSVTYVAYPSSLKKMKSFKDKFEKNNIDFLIQPFRGKYEGRIYPEGYTKEDKKFFSECFNLEENPPFVNYFIKDVKKKKTNENSKNTGKKLCRMGQIYAKIHSNGETYRCCAEGTMRLGNIITEDDFSLLDGPAICEIEKCPCWRAMIIGNENKWAKHWF